MKVSELVAALQKVAQVAGDIPVTLRHLESDVQTELRSLGVHIDPSSGDAAGAVALEHDDPKPATPAPADPPPDPPAAG